MKKLIFEDGVIDTEYGIKRPGGSKFVIIAPHAAGDDLKTTSLSAELAKALNAFLIINNKFYKKTSRRQNFSKDYAQDFNKLTWSKKREKYLWKKKLPAMKNFFEDIDDYCRQARGLWDEKKAFAIYIHGMKNKRTGIDIGVGLKARGDNNKFINSIRANNGNSGFTTIKISWLKKIKKELQLNLKKYYNLEVSVGKKYTGWSKQSAIQWHKHEGRDDYSIQLEINPLLRKKKNRKYLIKLISETFQKCLN